MAKLTKGDYVSRVLWSCSIMLGCPQEHSGSTPGALPEQSATLGAWPSVPFFVSGSLRERSGSNHVSPSKSGGCP